MKSKHSAYKSSLIVSLPAILFSGIAWALAAFYGSGIFSYSMMAIFLLATISRLWAYFSSKSIESKLSVSSKNVFPGQKVDVDITIKNNKFIPVAWMEIYMPLSKDLCLVPEETREPDQWEVARLNKLDASVKLIGTKKCGRMLWYEEARFRVSLEARYRGVSSLDNWSLNTGDGFGLSESDIKLSGGGSIAVYPRIIEVNTAPFLKNLWNANTGSRGVMEDLTVIRSTREYQTSDSLKHINWRLLSRGLPLTVNVYEDILPKSIHIIIDGESYSSPISHRKELEEALSIVASELIALKDHDLKCYLSICEGSTSKPVFLSPEKGLHSALFALASYEPYLPKLDLAGTSVVKQDSLFNSAAIIETALSVGRFYYFTYDASSISSRALLEKLGSSSVTIVSCCNDTKESFEVISQDSLKRKGLNG